MRGYSRIEGSQLRESGGRIEPPQDLRMCKLPVIAPAAHRLFICIEQCPGDVFEAEMLNDPIRSRLLQPARIKFRQYAGPSRAEQRRARILRNGDQNRFLTERRQPFRKTWMRINPTGRSMKRFCELRLLL
jgi:hypothetical protein